MMVTCPGAWPEPWGTVRIGLLPGKPPDRSPVSNAAGYDAARRASRERVFRDFQPAERRAPRRSSASKPAARDPSRPDTARAIPASRAMRTMCGVR